MQDEPDDSRRDAKHDDGAPKFGRLLTVLAVSVLIVVLLTLGSEAYYMH